MEKPGVDLYWLPLGAGGWFVRGNGKAYEALAAARDRRQRADLYHSALIVTVPEARFAIESAPVPRGDPAGRGVVCEGAVGHRALGRFRSFRYEVRCWRDGAIPDAAEAVDSPRRLTTDTDVALAQWQALYDTYLELGYDVHLIDPIAGLPDMVYAANGGFVIDGIAYGAKFTHRGLWRVQADAYTTARRGQLRGFNHGAEGRMRSCRWKQLAMEEQLPVARDAQRQP